MVHDGAAAQVAEVLALAAVAGGLTLRPRTLVVQRSRPGPAAQTAQTAAGKWTVPPGVQGTSTWAAQRSRWRAQARVKAVLGKREPVRTGHACP